VGRCRSGGDVVGLERRQRPRDQCCLKASLPHGAWLPWLKANADELGFGVATAGRLIKAASNSAPARNFTEAEAAPVLKELWGHSGRESVHFSSESALIFSPA